jgi:hypothetical protein
VIVARFRIYFIFESADKGSRFLRNAGIYIPTYQAARRHQSRLEGGVNAGTNYWGPTVLHMFLSFSVVWINPSRPSRRHFATESQSFWFSVPTLGGSGRHTPAGCNLYSKFIIKQYLCSLLLLLPSSHPFVSCSCILLLLIWDISSILRIRIWIRHINTTICYTNNPCHSSLHRLRNKAFLLGQRSDRWTSSVRRNK